MKTLADIDSNLEAFEKEYGIPVIGAEQGSEAWFKMKLGVLSASNASQIVAKVGSETRLTYMAELVAQVCTADFREISSKHMEWGKDHEDAARSYYEFSNGVEIQKLCFVFKDGSRREGCSPDGIVTVNKGVEIKCSWNTAHFIKFLCEEKTKPEFIWQNQFTLRCMEAEVWDFAQYDPRMRRNPMHVTTVELDLDKQRTLADAVPQFIHDMDKMLAKAGFAFGDQWRSI